MAFAFGLAVLAPACQPIETSQHPNDGVQGENAVKYTVGVLPMDARTLNANTRASLVNGEGSQAVDFDKSSEFYVTAWTEGVDTPAIPFSPVKFVQVSTASGTTGIWSTVDESDKIIEYRWYAGQKKTFYAYANLPADGNSVASCTDADSLTIDYVSPGTAAAQSDILLAAYKGDGSVGTEKSGTATLCFKHALAAIVVKVGSVNHILKINKVTVEKLAGSGRAKIDKDGNLSWTVDEKTGDIVQDFSANPIVPAAGIQIGEPALVIPEDFSADHKEARIRINVTTDYAIGNPTFDIFIPLNTLVFEAGTVYNISLNYGQEE